MRGNNLYVSLRSERFKQRGRQRRRRRTRGTAADKNGGEKSEVVVAVDDLWSSGVEIGF